MTSSPRTIVSLLLGLLATCMLLCATPVSYAESDAPGGGVHEQLGAPSESAGVPVSPAQESSAGQGGELVQQTATTSPAVPTKQVPTSATDNEPVLVIVAAIVALVLIAGGVVVTRRRLTDDP